MRRLLLNCLVVVIVALLFIFSSLSPSLAQASESQDSGGVDYDLPYPGILPDNSLYVFKTFRDMIVNFFISDPVKKARFELEAADKRLEGARLLFEKGRKDLAESTISKGENYFEDALKNIKISRMEGRPVDVGIFTDMELSISKYTDYLETMSKNSEGNLEEKFSDDLKRARRLSDEVKDLKLK